MIKKNIILFLILFILCSCGKKSYVVFNYNCNGIDYHKCELKNNKLNCRVLTPTCGEYKFKGWYRANEHNNQVDLNGTFNKNEIIYARWEKGNGRIEPSSSEEPTSTIVTPGIIDIPSSSSETPSSSKEEPSSSQQQVTPPTPVNPPKPEETYTISFNLNGGTGGQTASISGVKYNNNLPSINQNKPVKPGYTFMGWYDSQNGGTQYYNSSNSPVRKYDKKSNITLYAQWKINTLSIQYNGNGGTWANPSKDTYGVNSSNTVIVKSTNKVYQKVLNYGAKLESSGLVDYSGSWFKWTRSGYTVESKKEYIIGSTVIDQNKVYSAVELSRYAGCDLSKTDCTITVKVNWGKSVWSINKDYGLGKWVYHYGYSTELKPYYSSPIGFAELVPPKALESGDSLPIIIWFHGSGGENASAFRGGGLLKIADEWNTTGLKNIPAILMAPQLPDATTGWADGRPTGTIKAMIKYAKDKYNADTSKVVLMGHSQGGSGVVTFSKYNQNLFSALVIMSGYARSTVGYADYFKKMPMKGYSEVLGNVDPNTGERRKTGEIMTSFFKEAGHANDLKIYQNATHAQIPLIAFTEDLNNDKISDLIYWALSQKK